MTDADPSPSAPHSGVAALVLAAGGSQRLGRSKQLVELGGRTLIRRAIEATLDAMLKPVVVVLGCDAPACAAQLAGLNAAIVVNEDWSRGIGASLRAGLAHLERSTSPSAVLITLCDQPCVDAASLRRITTAHIETGAAVVAARYDGTLGVPALFAASTFDRLRALPDDAGAKRIIRELEPEVVAVDLPEAALDLDSEADVRRLQEASFTQRRRGAER